MLSRILAGTLVMLTIATGCQRSEQVSTATVSPAAATTLAPADTAVVASSTDPISISSTTAVAETTTPPTTTPSTTSSPTTVPPSSTSAPTSTTSTTTTTIAIAVQELTLRSDGIGSAVFGDDPDGVIGYIESVLGAPTDDTDWVDPFSFAACSGTEVRRIEWGVLALYFGDESPAVSGRRHLMAYTYGTHGSLGDQPSGLVAEGNIGLGSPVSDLMAAYPDVVVVPEDREFGSPASFFVSPDFRGILTGETPGDAVTVIFGGRGCGE